jgi:hypothetical protein
MQLQLESQLQQHAGSQELRLQRQQVCCRRPACPHAAAVLLQDAYTAHMLLHLLLLVPPQPSRVHHCISTAHHHQQQQQQHWLWAAKTAALCWTSASYRHSSSSSSSSQTGMAAAALSHLYLPGATIQWLKLHLVLTTTTRPGQGSRVAAAQLYTTATQHSTTLSTATTAGGRLCSSTRMPWQHQATHTVST